MATFKIKAFCSFEKKSNMLNKNYSRTSTTQSKNQKIVSIVQTLINVLLIPYFFVLIIVKKIARLILRKEFEKSLKYQNIFISNSNKYYRELEISKRRNKQLNNKILRIEYLLNHRCKKNSTITYEKTKKGIDVIVAMVEKESKNEIEIEFFDLESDFYASNRSLVLWCKRREKEYFINDIQGGNGNGHGEIAMNKLFDLAKRENITRISGELVPKDFDHRDRQIAFYQKMGFKITLSDDKQKGYIEKILVQLT